MTHTLRRERCTYAIISIFFGLSYIGRYVMNVCDFCGDGLGSEFDQLMIQIIVYFFEGASMGVLMLFHCKNFSEGSLFKTRREEETPYASIMPDEYYRFATEEVYAESLTEQSRYEIDNNSNDGEPAKTVGNTDKTPPLSAEQILNSSDIS